MVQLKPFEFEVATIERDEQHNQWVINRRSHQAWQWVEQLGKEILLEMVMIPGGSFTMGSPIDEPEREHYYEGPQHEVTMPQFLMSRYPVTQAQWQFVAGLPQINRGLSAEPSHFKGDNRPVEQVSWYDMTEFCDRLSGYTGREYWLPTEAEWEYACRAGTTTPFHFGETITTDLANYRGTDKKEYEFELSGSYGQGPKGEYRGETTPVDQFGIANAFGLCDMHGNVWEWCSDTQNGRHMLRGGSWGDSPKNCRSAVRNPNRPGFTNYYYGFRVVSVVPRT